MAPAKLNSEIRAHYASAVQKLKNAANHGAAGIIFLFTPEDQQRIPWDFAKARMTDPAILRQRAKVQLVGEQELESLMPHRVSIVEVTLTDGRTVSERVNDVRGTAENPMNRDEIIAKARDLITPVLGASGTQKLIDRIFDLERVKNLRELRPLLQRG